LSKKRTIQPQDFDIQFGRFSKGPKNCLTDVTGVKVGHTTLNSGKGPLKVGHGPVRTGVTAILPREDIWQNKVAAGSYVMNGNGEASGLMWIQESGLIETPIALTNTLCVANVQNGIIKWMLEKNPNLGITDDSFSPVVMECDDSTLNDLQGQHVSAEHTLLALKNASTDEFLQGAVGAGTGMISYQLKGGIGSSSRIVSINNENYTIAVLLNSNHGHRHTLQIAGRPVGSQLKTPLPERYKDGSIVVVVATDAPVDSRQLSRIAKRAMLGVARTGGISYHSSGDLAIAFTTANAIPHRPDEKSALLNHKILSDFYLDNLFEAASDACEEALIKSLLNAETVIGRDDMAAYALPHEELLKILSRKN
jgi:D-aminopeptidase